MIQQKRNLPHCKTVVMKNSGIVPSYTTVVDSKTMQQQLTTEPCSVVGQSGIRKQQDDIIHVVPKKTVRERIMKKIQKTKERLAVVSSRHQQQQQQQQEGGTSLAGGNSCLAGIVIGEISIPVSCCSNLRSSKNSNKAIEQEEEEKLRIRMTTVLGESPQEFLDNALTARGYSVRRYNTLESAYYTTETTLLQQASYGVRLLEMIDESNEEGLESCLLAGLHSNPCDEYGESALHRICRHGNMALLEILLDNDCNVQCADDFGRTPLHEACRCESLCFAVVETLIMQDIHLMFMADASGRLPLEYVKPEHWYDWMLFLEPRIDRYWPSLRRGRSTMNLNYEEQKSDCIEASQPPLTLLQPGSRPAADPDCPLTTELAWMVASGVIEPEEAISYMDEKVLTRFLPSIHKRLNDMAAEEERKEKLQYHNKLNGFGSGDTIDDDLTV